MVFFDGHSKAMSKSRAARITYGGATYWDPHWLQNPTNPGEQTADAGVGVDFM